MSSACCWAASFRPAPDAPVFAGADSEDPSGGAAAVDSVAEGLADSAAEEEDFQVEEAPSEAAGPPGAGSSFLDFDLVLDLDS